MTIRTTSSVVTFARAFFLPGFDAPSPPGRYRIDTDEESIEGAAFTEGKTWLAWRRVGAFIHLPAISARGSTREMAPVRPADLDAALERDHT